MASGTGSGAKRIGAIAGETSRTCTLTNCYYGGNAALAQGYGSATLTRVGSAHKVTLADGVSTTALASAPENGFVYDGVSYYREGLALPLACTEGDDY